MDSGGQISSCDDIGGWSDCRSLYDAGDNVKEE